MQDFLKVSLSFWIPWEPDRGEEAVSILDDDAAPHARITSYNVCYTKLLRLPELERLGALGTGSCLPHTARRARLLGNALAQGNFFDRKFSSPPALPE